MTPAIQIVKNGDTRWREVELKMMDHDRIRRHNTGRPGNRSSITRGEVIALLDEIEFFRKHVEHNDEEYRTMKEVLRAEHAEVERLRKTLDGIAYGLSPGARNAGMGAQQIVDNIREDHRRQLTAMTKARDEACDQILIFADNDPAAAERVAELRKVGQ